MTRYWKTTMILVLSLVVLGPSGALAPLGPAMAAGTEGAVGMAGKWVSNPDGGVTILKVNGSRVTGSYVGGAGHTGLTGTIEGTVQKGVFSGIFHNHEGEIHGQGRFTWTLKQPNVITGMWSSLDGHQKGSFTWRRMQQR